LTTPKKCQTTSKKNWNTSSIKSGRHLNQIEDNIKKNLHGRRPQKKGIKDGRQPQKKYDGIQSQAQFKKSTLIGCDIIVN
jgi:hypothetical protein